jgi:ketosteroid isomerase-like protein
MPPRRATVILSAALLAALACARASSPSSTNANASVAFTARGCSSVASGGNGAQVVGQVIGRAPPSSKPTVIGAAAGPASSSVRDPQVALREICAMMNASAARWNAGDLHGFMQDYMPGPGTTYIGRRGVVRGPDAIEAGYAPRFLPGAMHDSLSFEDVEVDLLAPDLTNTIAWYVLMRGDSLVARGPTSLVMRRVNGRWRIVHDHSS